MRTRLCLAFFAVSSLSTLLLGQQPHAFQPADKTSIEKLIDGYFQAFTEKNFDRLHDSFQAPFLRMSGRGSVSEETIEDAVKDYQGLRESLGKTDYAVSKAAEMRITALNSESALVDIHWQRLKKDGSLFGEGAEFLMVTKASGAWKICGSIGQNLADFGKIY